MSFHASFLFCGNISHFICRTRGISHGSFELWGSIISFLEPYISIVLSWNCSLQHCLNCYMIESVSLSPEFSNSCHLFSVFCGVFPSLDHISISLSSFLQASLFLLVLTGSLNSSGLGHLPKTTRISLCVFLHLRWSHFPLFTFFFCPSVFSLIDISSFTHSLFIHSRDIYWVTTMYLSWVRC